MSLPHVLPRPAMTFAEIKNKLIKKYRFLATVEGRQDREKHMSCHYHLTEVFCGAAAISRAFEVEGYHSNRIDVRIQHLQHNIHTKDGLWNIAEALVHTKPHSGTVLPGTDVCKLGLGQLGVFASSD